MGHPEVLRLLFLSYHYRSPVDYSEDSVALAQNLTVAAPASLTSPKFADPPVSRFDREAGGGHGALTFNSSPTVVVNSAGGRIDVEREIMGALRAHREELFNSLRREAARRERAQF